MFQATHTHRLMDTESSYAETNTPSLCEPGIIVFGVDIPPPPLARRWFVLGRCLLILLARVLRRPRLKHRFYEIATKPIGLKM